MNATKRVRLYTVLVALLMAGLADHGRSLAQTTDTSDWHPAGRADMIVARVNGEAIRLSDLDAYSRRADPKALFQLNQQLFDFREQMLEGLLGERLLAQAAERQGLTVDELLDRNLAPAAVADAEIAQTFERSQQAQIAAGQPPVGFELARPTIEMYLAGRHRAEAKADYIRQLRERGGRDGSGVSVALPVPRQELPVLPSDPVRGSGVEVIEFGDFQCRYCQQLEPVLQDLLRQFDGRVRLIWKDYPLPDHAFALDAAVAARCAGEQSQFWRYRALLFENQTALTLADLKGYAARVGLDRRAFADCVSGGRHRDEIAAAAEQGAAHGVAATPTLFINGRMVAGVKPMETYQRIIQQELDASTPR